MKKRLNEKVLKRGDVILTTSDAKISKFIRSTTISPISHAMLYVDNCSVIDATGDGVHSANTQRLFFEQHNAVFALRLKGGLPPSTSIKICNYVRERIGSEYATWEAGRAGLGLGKRGTPKQFCSRLVAQAYAANGFALVKNTDFCTPKDLLKSAELVEVADATVDVTDEEYQAWQTHPSGLNLMRQSTNHILNGARRIDKSIQNLSDVDKLVLEHSEHDETIMQLYVESGYFHVWKIDHEINPWHYDAKLMEDLGRRQPDDVRWYCESTLAEGSRTDNRYVTNAKGYQYYQSIRPRQTIMMLMTFYQMLAENHANRLDIAEDWLTRHP
ncbi:YiiX/YebB-like N1pC/P60 family cysteine hydrolase [Paenirhodobacter enshiensis]|uniref:YiiX/YebB-like N1pC/P60 family cysteine hydrolase n=1 Tax=Paenirhodobacter enshiensis TaxID=1105367 RepID=UPI0009DDD183|nr:YiiX/YebB-like N1pC/P60 family cysteine hydrolase [Paenirhodobacter enshiensis]